MTRPKTISTKTMRIMGMLVVFTASSILAALSPSDLAGGSIRLSISVIFPVSGSAKGFLTALFLPEEKGFAGPFFAGCPASGTPVLACVWGLPYNGTSGIIDFTFLSAIYQAFPFSIKYFATFSNPKLCEALKSSASPSLT